MSSASSSQPLHPRFGRLDRFATSCSALSALAQLEQLGVVPEDIRLTFHSHQHPSRTQIISQSPSAGSAVRHGQEVSMSLALDSIADSFPELLFVSLAGAEGRAQMDDARKLFAPFDKEQLLARSRLRRWNAVFSGALQDAGFTEVIFKILGLSPKSLERARAVLDPETLQDWLRILPLLHRAVGERQVVGALLTRFLGDPVELLDGHPREVDLPPDGSLHLSPGSGSRRGGLGTAPLGTRVEQTGAMSQIRIGPLSRARAARYLADSWKPRMQGSQAVFAVDLGPVCQFDDHWRVWEQGGTDGRTPSLPGEGRWPRCVYLLEHLMPAGQTAHVDLLVDRDAAWQLGDARESEGTKKAPAEELHASTLGAWTVLRESSR